MANYNLEGPAWTDLTVTWSFATANFPGQPSTFDGFFSPGAFESEISTALADWQQYSTLTFVQATDSPDVEIRFGYAHIDGPFGTLGLTDYFFSGDEFLPDVMVTFDVDEQYSFATGHPQLSNGVTFLSTALHEIGHALGLAHYDAAPAIMNTFASSTVTDLTGSDIAGIQALYGTPFVDVAKTDVNSAPLADFDGNGRSDILFRNDAGQIAVWQTNTAGVLTSIAALGSASADWHIDGTGDFNHDGRGDILFRNDDQRLAVWQTNGQQIRSIDVLGSASSAWHSSGMGDFNSDGTTDLLFRNDNGQIAQWLINNNRIQSIQVLGSTSSAFHIVGISDFNGDGKADLLFRDNAGVLATWLLNGNQLQSVQVLGSTGTDSHLVGTGDFNGDGTMDLLWHNDSGQIAEWLMNGAAIQSIQVVGSPGAQNHVEGTGDFNGDGRSDILLRDNAGTLAEWLMDGAAIQSAQQLGTAPVDFHVSAHHFDLI